MSAPDWDVVVIGAGPAGSTAGALLADRGVRVLVLDKHEFPRAHIGESLLPASSLVQDVLKIAPRAEVFLKKGGAEFIDEASERRTTFNFKDALPGPPRHAYHVERPLFDTLLRDRARELGAEVRHGVQVEGVDIDDQGVRVRCGSHVERARFVVDATGQDRLLGRQARTIEPFQHFGKAASYVHFEGLSRSTVDDFAPDNNIRVLFIEDGWIWNIPLPGDRLSVGVVSRRGGMSQDDVLGHIERSPTLRQWTHGARRSETNLVGNFSFRNQRSYGARFACIGDAACFIDPVFSSGVSLAIRGAMSLVDQLAPALAEGREADPQLAAPVSQQMSMGYDTFASLVYRFYNTRFVDNFLLGVPPEGIMLSSAISVLAGDVFGEQNPFRDMLLRSRQQPWRRTAPQQEAADRC